MPVALDVTADNASINDVLRRAARMEGAVRSAAQNVVNRYAALIAREAKGLAPFDSGDLRSTIRYELERLAAEVISGGIEGKATGKVVDYADVVELGRRDNPAYKPQPHVAPAFERHAPAFLKDLTDAVQAAIAREGAAN